MEFDPNAACSEKGFVACAISDQHGFLPRVPPCDLLLIAGDIVPLGVQHDYGRSRSWLRGPFRQWLDRLSVGEVIAIAGNHDFWALSVGAGRHDGLFDIPWVYLCDATHRTISGLRVHGTPWQLEFTGGWAFEGGETLLAERFSLVPENTDILLVHGPPYGTGDRGPVRSSGGSATQHAGSIALLNTIRRVNPQLTVFGHIHEGGGELARIDPDDFSSGLLANVSILDGNYRPVRRPAQFTLRTPCHK